MQPAKPIDCLSGSMVTLRSQDKQAAGNDDSNAAQTKAATALRVSGRTGRRSATPDRSSQDSGLRRSQRVKDRHGALESIQEDTAASKGDQAISLPNVKPLQDLC